MDTIKFLEETKNKVANQTLNTKFDSKEYNILAQIHAQIKWHINKLKEETLGKTG